jgi:hypothetical protein
MSGNYFGSFQRTLFSDSVASQANAGTSNDFFNRPDGCTAQEVPEPLAGVTGVTINRPNGILDCSNGGDQWRWVLGCCLPPESSSCRLPQAAVSCWQQAVRCWQRWHCLRARASH